MVPGVRSGYLGGQLRVLGFRSGDPGGQLMVLP
jgi:hypothetical protein